VMIFAGPFSPRFTADTLVVSVNVGEGGPPPAPAPGEALCFPCEFVAIVKGRRGRDFGIWERCEDLAAAGGGERERGAGRMVEAFGALRFASGGLKWSALYARREWNSLQIYSTGNETQSLTPRSRG
jgi:hypothetical protein